MSKLDNAMKITLLLSGLVYLADSGSDLFHYATSRGKGGVDLLSYQASSSGEAATVTFTNTNKFSAFACVKGVVVGPGGAKVETLTVCTGDVKPRSTVQVTAPYRVGAVLALCNKTVGGNKYIDWADCKFDVVDQTRLAM